jgi:hypothetical protein
VSVDELHVAFPKLFGAPAYARPPAPVAESERPVDRDDLPLVAELTPEERALLAAIEPAETWAMRSISMSASGFYVNRQLQDAKSEGDQLRARPFSLRSFTGRLRRQARA